jgi:tyrosyl-tRNA synthetase
MSDGERIDLIDELRWRGLLHQCTDEDGLRRHLETGTRRIYAGFDPTADSLTIGNLVPIMLLAHVKRAGHEAVVVMGGGTGLIGDPSGKSAERTLMTRERVAEHIRGQRPIFDAVLGGVPGPAHRVLNNLDWLGGLSYIDALRDIGKHFSVNMMMQKDSVKSRLESREQGISYTEFSYMILQAYDFAHLYEHEGVTVQMGGSDQFGNIVAGGDLVQSLFFTPWIQAAAALLRHIGQGINGAKSASAADLYGRLAASLAAWASGERSDSSERFNQLDFQLMMSDAAQQEEPFSSDFKKFMLAMVRVHDEMGRLRPKTFGLTVPLVTKADGGKFGKTETGAVWLTADRTSPYAYFQFWLNATDADAENWIKIFTFLDEATVTDLIGRHRANPGARELQRRLAQEATTILHGRDATERAEAAAKALFSGEIAGLDEATLGEVFADVPSSEHAKAALAGEGVDPVELLKQTGLAASNREAREFLGNGSVSVNGVKIDAQTRLTADHLLHGSVLAIRRGKKNWHLTRWA